MTEHALSEFSMSNQCHSCGKADANLKACKACKLVKYCGVECQVAHQPAHEKACREKARELFDEKLFSQPKKKEECTICIIPLPCRDEECTYMSCCGKTICDGCRYCLTREHCPFCNTPAARSDEEIIKRLSERIEKYNDPEAMHLLGCRYICGFDGLQVDESKAFELLQRASELGSAAAHYSLGIAYKMGEGVEIDMKKAVHHWQIAAMMGHMASRNNLACIEFENRNYQCAMRHFMVAARCGCEKSLHNVKEGFKEGLVTKEEFEKTLRGYQDALEETKSEQRDRAAAIIQAGQTTK